MGKWWKVVVAAAVAVVALTLGAMYYVAGTPQYSLYIVRNAVREGDKDTFYYFFDFDRVVRNTISRKVGGIQVGPGFFGKDPDLGTPVAKRLIRERIEEKLAKPQDVPFDDLSIEDVRYEGKSAYVTLRKKSDGSTSTIAMERMPDRHWKIVDMDLDAVKVPFDVREMG